MNTNSRIYVAGHKGLVGSAIHQSLEQAGFTRLILRTRTELDLTNHSAVHRFFEQERPEFVFLAAAKVGGIQANSQFPAEFIHENLAIQTNVIEACYRAGVERLLFLGSSCIYPKLCPQPIKEEFLLTGPLEPSNRPYAIAKIAGIELCWAYNRQYGTRYLTVMPTNLYGPHDNFDLNTSHVLPALMRKVAEAKASGADHIVVWGTGTPRREFLFSKDLAEACVFLMDLSENKFCALLAQDHPPLINIGVGEDLSIRELAELVSSVLGYKGKLIFDLSKPDGTPRKLLDVSLIHALGWRAKTSLHDGILQTYHASSLT